MFQILRYPLLVQGVYLSETLTFSSNLKWYVVIFKCLISFLLPVLKVCKEFSQARVADHIKEIMNYFLLFTGC